MPCEPRRRMVGVRCGARGVYPARWFLQVDEDMPKARVYRID